VYNGLAAGGRDPRGRKGTVLVTSGFASFVGAVVGAVTAVTNAAFGSAVNAVFGLDAEVVA